MKIQEAIKNLKNDESATTICPKCKGKLKLSKVLNKLRLKCEGSCNLDKVF